MGLRVRLVKPSPNTSPVDEVNGAMRGADAPAGNATSPRRSTTVWRIGPGRAPSANCRVTTDRPCTDCERMEATPGTPPSAFSIGRVTSCSTCSATRPGASAWITVSAGVRAGKISTGRSRTHHSAAAARTSPASTTNQGRRRHQWISRPSISGAVRPGSARRRTAPRRPAPPVRLPARSPWSRTARPRRRRDCRGAAVRSLAGHGGHRPSPNR